MRPGDSRSRRPMRYPPAQISSVVGLAQALGAGDGGAGRRVAAFQARCAAALSKVAAEIGWRSTNAADTRGFITMSNTLERITAGERFFNRMNGKETAKTGTDTATATGMRIMGFKIDINRSPILVARSELLL